MQLRNSGVGVVACSLNDPQNPVKPLGSVAGSFSSPRLAMKMRFGLSASAAPLQEKGGDDRTGPYDVVPGWPQRRGGRGENCERREEGGERCSHEDLLMTDPECWRAEARFARRASHED